MAIDAGVEVRRLLATMSGHPIGDQDYVSYFVNEFGERLIYVRERKKRHAVLLHSDLDWEPKLVTGPPKAGGTDEQLPADVRRFLDDVPVVGDFILDHPEAMWLKACLAATQDW
ncbi:hypothetical protein ACWEFJ_18465 [Actinosynnema sp. NPDC004786]